MKREFKGVWIPKHIWINNSLTISEKLMLVEIDSYDNEFGCVATNKTLCEDIRIKPSTASGIIKGLEAKGYVSVTYRNDQTFEGRVIKMRDTPLLESVPPSAKSGGASARSEPSNTFSNTLSDLYIKAESEKDSAEGDKKESTVKAKKKKGEVRILNFSPEESKEVYGSVKQFFLDLYLKEYHTEYYFEPLNGAKIHSIIRKVIFKMKEKQQREDFTKKEVIDTTNYFVNTAYLLADNFLKSNFNLSNIDSKFNDSYSKISNRHNPAANINGGKPVSKFRTTA